MIRNRLVVVSVVALLGVGGSASAQEVPAVAAATSTAAREPTTALYLRVGASSGVGVSGVGLGGVGLGVIGMGAPPSAGFVLEHQLAPHWAATLGVLGDYSRVFAVQASSLMLTLEPGVRWYPGTTPLSGGWISAALPLGWSGYVVGTSVASAFSGSLDLCVGWTFRWPNGFLASLGAGPSIRLSRTATVITDSTGSLIGGVSDSGHLGLRANLSVGLAL